MGVLSIFQQVDSKTNPANHISSFTLRSLTKLLYGALHGKLLIYPAVLCCDWSGSSVPTIDSLSDVRIPATLAFYVVVVAGSLFAYLRSKRCVSVTGKERERGTYRNTNWRRPSNLLQKSRERCKVEACNG